MSAQAHPSIASARVLLMLSQASAVISVKQESTACGLALLWWLPGTVMSCMLCNSQALCWLLAERWP